MTDNSWILELRTDFLTSVFKLFPLLAKDYFYITIIALGYWLNPSKRIFKSLGFLIPFSTLLNCLLKNYFKIPRPDVALHLVPVHDPFGFPSGDIQVAIVFWTYILLQLRSKLRYLCLLPIIGIAISIVYLGVHSIYDVAGGMIIGLTTLYLWRKYLETPLFENYTNSRKLYWGLLITIILIYAFVSQNLKWPPMVPIAIGALIGFGTSLRWLANQEIIQGLSIQKSILFLAIVIIMAFTIPVIKTNELIVQLSLVLKYFIVTFSVFYLIPKINGL